MAHPLATQASTLLANQPIPTLAEEEFRLFQTLVLRESGIHLGEKNRAMLVSRLWKRLRALGVKSFAAYYRHVKKDPDEMVRMLDCLCTNETRFFREPAAFDCLRQVIFPLWRDAALAGERDLKLRVWSAACSSGEEAYSLAMILLSEFPPSDRWRVEILGTDLSTKALDRAVTGIWPAERVSVVPVEYHHRFLLKGFGPEKGKVKITEELRRVVQFKRLNLTHDSLPISGAFDLIFCRNVLIYFDWQTKLQVVNRLGRLLAPDGYLFLGHAESLHGVTDKLESVVPKTFETWKPSARALCVLQRRNSRSVDALSRKPARPF
jgi:chemotaxis protein methyltransferase CheR